MFKDNPEPQAGHFPLPVSSIHSIPSATSYKGASSFQQTQEQRAATISIALKNMFSSSKEQKNG